eukprot:701429-Amphidinium_carterae.1
MVSQNQKCASYHPISYKYEENDGLLLMTNLDSSTPPPRSKRACTRPCNEVNMYHTVTECSMVVYETLFAHLLKVPIVVFQTTFSKGNIVK